MQTAKQTMLNFLKFKLTPKRRKRTMTMMSSIKNLSRQLNEAGKIKIGKKGKMITSAKGNEFRPPVKLDHFQLVTTEKDKNGDYIVDVGLQNKIKETGSGMMNQDKCLVGLPIRLLYNDDELNFPHMYISYSSGKMSCYGDGEKSFKRVNNFEKETKCPCERIKPGYDKKDKCKPTGTLTCVIDEADLFGQAHKFRTTSMNTIKGILGGLEMIKKATGGRIAGLPLMLTMNPKNTITPEGHTTTVHIVSICYRGSMDSLRGSALKLLESERRYLIGIDSVEQQAKEDIVEKFINIDEKEEAEFVEEFFPDQVDVKITRSSDTVIKNDVNVDALKNVSLGKVETEEPETIEEEIETTESEETNEDQPVKGALEPVDDYAKIYDKFVFEEDLDKAMTFAKRLQRGNLVFWLIENYKDIAFDPKMKKPELLVLIKKVLISTLDSKPEKNTESEDKAVEEEVVVKKTEEVKTIKDDKDIKEVFIREWDDSGEIKREQLLKIVKLKGHLEKKGILKPHTWITHVNYFLDAEKVSIDSAKNLTTKQGDTFIKMLAKNDDGIPF